MSKHTKANGKKKKTGKEIAVIFFAIFIAISMMVPSIGYIVSYYQYQNSQNEQITPEQVNETFEKQIASLNESIAASPEDANLYGQLGSVYLQWASFSQYFPKEGDDVAALVTERANKALEAFNTSLEKGETENAVVGKSLALSTLGKAEEAKATLEGYLKDHPESVMALETLARAFEMEGNSEKAIETYEKLKAAAGESNAEVSQKAQEAIDRIKAAAEKQAAENKDADQKSDADQK